VGGKSYLQQPEETIISERGAVMLTKAATGSPRTLHQMETTRGRRT
jgi:hypothetical protein